MHWTNVHSQKKLHFRTKSSLLWKNILLNRLVPLNSLCYASDCPASSVDRLLYEIAEVPSYINYSMLSFNTFPVSEDSIDQSNELFMDLLGFAFNF